MKGKTIQKVIEVYVRLSPVISSKNASLSQFTLQSSFDIIASMVHREKLWQLFWFLSASCDQHIAGSYEVATDKGDKATAVYSTIFRREIIHEAGDIRKLIYLL